MNVEDLLLEDEGLQNLMPQRPFSHIIFSKQEDAKLLHLYNLYPNSWQQIALNMQNRSARVCRDRWRYLNSQTVNHWAKENDFQLIDAVRIYGHDWHAISTRFPDFTEEFLKNRWTLNLKYKIVDDYVTRYLRTMNSNKIGQDVSDSESSDDSSDDDMDFDDLTDFSSDFDENFLSDDYFDPHDCKGSEPEFEEKILDDDFSLKA